MGIQQHPNQGRRRMESRLLDPRRAIRTNSNVLWTYELPRNLPDDDEHHIPHRSRSRMAIRIHGRHRDPHETRKQRNGPTTPRTTPTLHPSYASQTRTKRSVSKTRKMRLRTKRNRLPRCHRRKRSNTNGPKETQRRRRLARPTQPNRNTKIPRIHRLLSLLRPRLLKNSAPLVGPYKESCRL